MLMCIIFNKLTFVNSILLWIIFWYVGDMDMYVYGLKYEIQYSNIKSIIIHCILGGVQICLQ